MQKLSHTQFIALTLKKVILSLPDCLVRQDSWDLKVFSPLWHTGIAVQFTVIHMQRECPTSERAERGPSGQACGPGQSSSTVIPLVASLNVCFALVSFFIM